MSDLPCIEEYDINEENFMGSRLHRSTFEHCNLSTVFANDTRKYETMFISPKGEYLLLQVYDKAPEAKSGHQFWTRKVREGFVPEGDLASHEFTPESLTNLVSILTENAPEIITNAIKNGAK